MDFTKLKVGDVLEIKRKRYEIIKFMKDYVCLPPNYEVRDTLYFGLLQKESKKITPTHHLVYYLDTKRVYFSGETGKGILLKKDELKVIS